MRCSRASSCPQARVALGVALRGIATACIDISDGLLGDLGKLCAASGVGADLASRELPLSAGLCSVAAPEDAAAGSRSAAATTTSCCSLRARQTGRRLAALDAGVVLRRIGAITEAGGVRVDGAPPGRDAGHGFDHFG